MINIRIDSLDFSIKDQIECRKSEELGPLRFFTEQMHDGDQDIHHYQRIISDEPYAYYVFEGPDKRKLCLNLVDITFDIIEATY